MWRSVRSLRGRGVRAVRDARAVDDVVGIAIGAGSALVAAFIGAGAALWVHRSDQRARRNDEHVAAMQAFAPVMDLLVP